MVLTGVLHAAKPDGVDTRLVCSSTNTNTSNSKRFKYELVYSEWVLQIRMRIFLAGSHEYIDEYFFVNDTFVE